MTLVAWSGGGGNERLLRGLRFLLRRSPRLCLYCNTRNWRSVSLGLLRLVLLLVRGCGFLWRDELKILLLLLPGARSTLLGLLMLLFLLLKSLVCLKVGLLLDVCLLSS